MCHTFARCNRSISIPAPVAYAHVAAARARDHNLVEAGFDDGSDNDVNEALESGPDMEERVNTALYMV